MSQLAEAQKDAALESDERQMRNPFLPIRTIGVGRYKIEEFVIMGECFTNIDGKRSKYDYLTTFQKLLAIHEAES